MKSILLALLLFGSALWADEIPTYFFFGPQSMGSVQVSDTNASGALQVCDFPTPTCTPSYFFTVTTPSGSVESWTTYERGMPGPATVHQLGNFGMGGTINIWVNHTFFLSGYLLSANAVTWSTTYSVEYWDRSMSGTFKALVLNEDYWGNTDPGAVGGTFSIGTAFPHSPFVVGYGHLAVFPTPEPMSLALLLAGVGMIGRRWRSLRSC